MSSSLRVTRCLFAALSIVALPAEATAAVKRMFLTSASGTGDLQSWAQTNLDGVAGANEICQTLAEAAGLSPGSETFRAFLSDAGTDAYCNVQGLSGKRSDAPACAGGTEVAGGPWVRTDGKLFASSLAQLVSNSQYPYVPARVFENGTEASTNSGRIWTGSSPTGVLGASSCSGFQLASGSGLAGRQETLAFGSGNGTTCTGSHPLLCFETGAGDPIPEPSAPGRLAFLAASTGSGLLEDWEFANGQTGIAAGDEVCQKEAENAKLPEPESFRAWLSTTSTDAYCHIQGLGGTRADGCGGATLPPAAPYRRLDGIEVAADLADLTDGTIDTPMLDLTGFPSFGIAFTGTEPDGTVSLSTCADWLDGTSGSMGEVGQLAFVTPLWTGGGPVTCDLSSIKLRCFSTVVTVFWDGFESGNPARWIVQP